MRKKSQRELQAETFPPTPIENMGCGELEVALTGRNFPHKNTEELYRFLFRIIRFPKEESLILAAFKEIIERELDRRNLNRAWKMTFASAVIALFAACAAWIPFFQSLSANKSKPPQTQNPAPLSSEHSPATPSAAHVSHAPTPSRPLSPTTQTSSPESR